MKKKQPKSSTHKNKLGWKFRLWIVRRSYTGCLWSKIKVYRPQKVSERTDFWKSEFSTEIFFFFMGTNKFNQQKNNDTKLLLLLLDAFDHHTQNSIAETHRLSCVTKSSSASSLLLSCAHISLLNKLANKRNDAVMWLPPTGNWKSNYVPSDCNVCDF